jgi:hypothetical protein
MAWRNQRRKLTASLRSLDARMRPFPHALLEIHFHIQVMRQEGPGIGEFVD